MSRDFDPAEQLRQSWEANARAWTSAVREGQIESRRVATDAALLQAVLEHSPRRVLDVGCGEGWLARALAAQEISVVGVDASAPLIEAACQQGGGTFHLLSYAELATFPEQIGSGFGTIVCNFSLLEESIAPLLLVLHRVLAPGGILLIQTVHPWSACEDGPYQDSWRTETFSGFGGTFTKPMPWYFRTLGSWLNVLRTAGWQVQQLREPLHPETGRPLSLLLICGSTASP